MDEGELVGLLGPNGAGKSTLVRSSSALSGPVAAVRSSSARRQVRAWRGRRSGTSPSSSASPAGTRPTRCSSCTSGSRGRAAAPRNGRGCSSWSRSPTPATGASTACRKGCSSVSGSRRRSSASPGLAPGRADVRARSGRPAHRPPPARGASLAAASRFCSTRTCSPRSSSSATAWRSCSAASSSRRARPAELSRGRGVELDTDEGVRLVEGATRDDAPRLVAEAVAAGRRVYGVRVLASTLEDVYLEAVGGETD